MGKRQQAWARKQRDILFDKLGRVCVKCGATTNLTFDLIVPSDVFVGDDKQAKHSRRMEFSWRMSFYRKQYEAGNIQVLCDNCNTKKGHTLQLNPNLKEEQPF